jgi:hypothetical protein
VLHTQDAVSEARDHVELLQHGNHVADAAKVLHTHVASWRLLEASDGELEARHLSVERSATRNTMSSTMSSTKAPAAAALQAYARLSWS